MQPLFGEPCVSRVTTGRAVRIVDRVLAANGAARVRDLPEEARVRLYRQLTLFFEHERETQWERQINGSPFRRLRRWLAESIETARQTLQS